jgi:hypothetical protein
MEKSPVEKQKSLKCELCDYVCFKNSEYIRHLLTRKHVSNASGNNKNASADIKCKFCSKIYKSKKGLWGHNKVCDGTKEILPENTVVQQDSSNNDIIQLLIKENSDFKTMIMDLVKSNTDLQKQMMDKIKNS